MSLTSMADTLADRNKSVAALIAAERRKKEDLTTRALRERRLQFETAQQMDGHRRRGPKDAMTAAQVTAFNAELVAAGLRWLTVTTAADLVALWSRQK